MTYYRLSGQVTLRLCLLLPAEMRKNQYSPKLFARKIDDLERLAGFHAAGRHNTPFSEAGAAAFRGMCSGGWPK